MEQMRIDLHMHSDASIDGEFTGTQLVEMCHEANINIMAISDHNSIKSVQAAKKRAVELKMSYIEAVELDCTYQGLNFHVVGYGIDSTNPAFEQLEHTMRQQELALSAKKLALVNQLGFNLSKAQMDAVAPHGIYAGEMFCEVLLADPRYQDHELLKPYREGGTRYEGALVNFHWDYFAQGKPCYLEVKLPSLQEILTLIHESGGLAVLAHPGNNLKNRFELFDDMVKEGIQGVECYSSYHTPEVTEFFRNKAKEYNLLITCGSDFHGKTKPHVQLGGHGCIETNEIVEQLKQRNII